MQHAEDAWFAFKYGTTRADQTAQTQYSVKLITVTVKDTEVSAVYQLLAVSKSTNRGSDPAGVKAEAHLYRNWLLSWNKGSLGPKMVLWFPHWNLYLCSVVSCLWFWTQPGNKSERSRLHSIRADVRAECGVVLIITRFSMAACSRNFCAASSSFRSENQPQSRRNSWSITNDMREASQLSSPAKPSANSRISPAAQLNTKLHTCWNRLHSRLTLNTKAIRSFALDSLAS